eukprot:EG_transcript_19974
MPITAIFHAPGGRSRRGGVCPYKPETHFDDLQEDPVLTPRATHEVGGLRGLFASCRDTVAGARPSPPRPARPGFPERSAAYCAEAGQAPDPLPSAVAFTVPPPGPLHGAFSWVAPEPVHANPATLRLPNMDCPGADRQGCGGPKAAPARTSPAASAVAVAAAAVPRRPAVPAAATPPTTASPPAPAVPPLAIWRLAVSPPTEDDAEECPRHRCSSRGSPDPDVPPRPPAALDQARPLCGLPINIRRSRERLVRPQ